MERVGGEQHAAQAQLLDHPLGRRDLVALGGDLAVRQQDRRLRGERAERLGRLAVGEVVDAALERLAVERDRRHPALGARQQAGGVPAERPFQGGAVEVLQHGVQGVDRRRPPQGEAEQRVEHLPALLQEDGDAAVRGRAGQQRQHREQQQRRQRIALALRAPRIGNLAQGREEPAERYHGNPQSPGIADKDPHIRARWQTLSTRLHAPPGLAARESGTQRGRTEQPCLVAGAKKGERIPGSGRGQGKDDTTAVVVEIK